MQVLQESQTQDPNVIVGLSTPDDAGVYRLNNELAIVQTVDFFPPVIDDPFLYGRIAAVNAMSDVYAMGGSPRTALNIVAFPDNELSLEILKAILKGGSEGARAADCVIVGGHSVRDSEIKYGMAVTGVVHPDKVVTIAGAQDGDRLILTKPLGTGFVTTAYRKGKCSPLLLDEAIQSMCALNRAACEAMLEVGVSAATDITGFGLAGHAYGMAKASQKTLHFYWNKLPLFKDLPALIDRRFFSRANRTNRSFVSASLEMKDTPSDNLEEIFFDPQTSGGLLISVAHDKSEELLTNLRKRGIQRATEVGYVSQLSGAHLVITKTV